MNLQTSDFAALNDDECKRILAVIERDFRLRQKEAERLKILKEYLREENERVKYLLLSPDFNAERCIRCYQPFKFFFNPREKCSLCQLFVCRQCSTEKREEKQWFCHSCQRVKDLSILTSNWFYDRSSEKHKRCGSAKVVRELHKREKELAELDDDLGYGTLPASFTTETRQSNSNRYVIHDKTIRRELAEFCKRLNWIIDNILMELSSSKDRTSLKKHQDSIHNELRRARTALSQPLRQMKITKTNHLEYDLQNVIIQQVEDLLRIDLEEFQKMNTMKKALESNEFDEKLAEIIMKKHILNREKNFFRSFSSDRVLIKPAAKQINRRELRQCQTDDRIRLEIIRFSNQSDSSDESDEIISTWL